MARLRYSGDDKDGRLVPLSGGAILCPRMKWVDLVAEAARHGIREEHAQIVATDLVTQADWESETPVKAARTRKQNAAEAETTDPAVPDKETDQ